MLFHLYKTPEEISERIESNTIESAFLRRLIAEARYIADHPDKNRFVMQEINALCRQETQPTKSIQCSPREHLNDASLTEECLICGEKMCVSDFFALECGHKFCTNCWKEYIGNNSDNVFMVSDLFSTHFSLFAGECQLLHLCILTHDQFISLVDVQNEVHGK